MPTFDQKIQDTCAQFTRQVDCHSLRDTHQIRTVPKPPHLISVVSHNSSITPTNVPEPGALGLAITGAILLLIVVGISAWRNRPRIHRFSDEPAGRIVENGKS